MGGLGERRVGGGFLADLPVIDQVAGRVVVDLGRAVCQGLLGIGDGGQHLIVHLDRFGGDPGQRLGLGDHHGGGVADIAHLFSGQRRPSAHVHRAAILRRDGPSADDVADAVAGQLVAVEHVDDPLHRQGRAFVDALDLRMGMGRADKGGVGLVLAAHIIGIFALAGDEPLVFLALDARTNSRGHGVTLPYIFAAASSTARTML